MGTHVRLLAVFLVLTFMLGGCEAATAIPAGAQQVHVDATGPTVALDPATVHAGDVYLVVDLPPGGASLALLKRSGGPLSDADLARLTQAGDEQGLSISGIDNSCCGRIHKETLAVGMYAFVLGADVLRPGVPPSAITILQVTP